LSYEIAKLQTLQQSVDLTRDEESAKELASRIREQASTCLKLLDHYQSSAPGRMWFDAERQCKPLRDELKRTEMLFRVNAGEWNGRVLASSSVYRASDWALDGLYEPAGEPSPGISNTGDEDADADPTSRVPEPLGAVEADYRQSLDGLMALVEEVELERGPATEGLRFTLPTAGDPPEQTMLVLVPGETGLIYEHRYGGSSCRQVEIEGFLVPAWAHPDATTAFDQLFSVDLGGNGVRDDDRSEVVRAIGQAIKWIWYRGTGDRIAPLQIDEERADEIDESWVPVLTPDGPGYLTWVSSH
jgi:hypothetical protein